MQKLVKKATDKTDTPWGLDWFVQAGHGGNGNRNCTLAEDATLATPAYPLVYAADGTDDRWARPRPGRTRNPAGAARRACVSGTAPNQNMWRWQSMQEFQYPLIEYLVGAQERAAVHRPRVGRRRPRAQLDVGDHGPDAGVDRSRSACRRRRATRRSAMPPRWRNGSTASIAATRTRAAATPSVGGADGNNWNCSVTGSAERSGPELERRRAEADARRRRGQRRSAATQDRRSDEVDGAVPSERQLLRARASRARRPVQPERQQRLQHRAPAQLQQRGADGRVRLGDAAGPRRVGCARRIHDPAQQHRRRATSTPSAARPTAAPASTARRSAACGTRCSAKAATAGSSRAPTGTTAAASARTIAARRRTSIPGEYQRDYVMVDDRRRRASADELLTPQRSSTACAPATASPRAGQLIDRLAFVACADTRSKAASATR